MLLPGYNRKMVVTNRDRAFWLLRSGVILAAVLISVATTLLAKALGLTALELLAMLFVPVLLFETAREAWRRRQN